MTRNIPLLLTVWVVVTLAIYRAQRIVTADHWPPSEWFRGTVKQKYGEDSSWYKLITCPYCFGTWLTIVASTLTHIHVVDLLTARIYRPGVFLLYVVIAFCTLVGKLGASD